MKTHIPCPRCDGAGEVEVRFTIYKGRMATRVSPAEPAEFQPLEWETDCDCHLDEGEIIDAMDGKEIP